MKSFTKANMEDSLEFTWSLFILLLIVNCYIGIILALAVIIFNINHIFHSRRDCSFTKANMEDSLEFTWSLFILLLIGNCYIGIILALAVFIFNINRMFHSRGDEILH